MSSAKSEAGYWVQSSRSCTAWQLSSIDSCHRAVTPINRKEKRVFHTGMQAQRALSEELAQRAPYHSRTR
jgi:hypothetical protein